MTWKERPGNTALRVKYKTFPESEHGDYRFIYNGQLQNTITPKIVIQHTIGCKIAATRKTPATKQKNTVVTEQNWDSMPSLSNPISTTSITRLYIVEKIAASNS